MTPLEQQLKQWLSLLKFPIAKKYLQQYLLAHPDYPSLLSITDTLSNLGIENAPLLIDKDNLGEMPLPFLAHVQSNGGEFVLVEDLQTLPPDFFQNWNGIVVLAEKPEHLLNKENAQLLKKEKATRLATTIAVSTGIVFSITALFYNPSVTNNLLLLTTLMGVTAVTFIAQHTLGYKNPIVDQLCASSKHTDCNAVLQSKGSKLGWLNWADAGIIYFFSSWLLIIQALLTGSIAAYTGIAAILSLAAIPFTFFSLYYQWRVVKKWCVLCLITVGILWAQFLLLLPSLSSPQGAQTVLAAFVFLLTTVIWMLCIKPLLQQQHENEEKIWPLLRLKRNAQVFMTVLETQPRVNTTPFTHDLQIGNADAPIQIMVACSLYCNPCAKMHETLQELLAKNENDLGLTIRFVVKTDDQALSYILQYIKQEGRQSVKELLHDWYTIMNYEAFTKKYIVTTPLNVNSWLKDHAAWSEQSQIEFTPTLFINGYRLPPSYTVHEVALMLQGIKENIIAWPGKKVNAPGTL